MWAAAKWNNPSAYLHINVVNENDIYTIKMMSIALRNLAIFCDSKTTSFCFVIFYHLAAGFTDFTIGTLCRLGINWIENYRSVFSSAKHIFKFKLELTLYYFLICIVLLCLWGICKHEKRDKMAERENFCQIHEVIKTWNQEKHWENYHNVESSWLRYRIMKSMKDAQFLLS